MSQALGAVDLELGARAVRAVASLPEVVGLVSPRTLAWPMADLLESGFRLNLLSLEALAAAEHLGADICLADADENPPLLAAAVQRGVTVRLIA